MKTIFKTWKKSTYFEGRFLLLDEKSNRTTPIDFPTVFTAFGPAIQSGNWQSCTSINTPDYVIEHYFDGIGHERHHTMGLLWERCKHLSEINWDDVKTDKNRVLNLINLANNELNKLQTLTKP